MSNKSIKRIASYCRRMARLYSAHGRVRLANAYSSQALTCEVLILRRIADARAQR